MFLKKYLIILIAFVYLQPAVAQQAVSGTVYDKYTDSILVNANVRNQRTGASTSSDNAGKFRIAAGEKDILIFTYRGYRNDTLMVNHEILAMGFSPALEPTAETLQTVYVSNRDYASDSLERRNENSAFYNKPMPKLVGSNTPSSGFGISVSPLSYFSKEAKQKRRLKAKLQKEEEDAYVDFQFNEPFVSYVTGLKGQALQDFMLSYRPTYTFCRSTDKEGMLEYVRTKLAIFHALKRKTP